VLRNIRVLNSVAALAIVTALATIGGVAISTERTAAQQPSLPAPEMGRSDLLTLDEQMLEVGKQDPAFGGMFFSEDGRLTMYVQANVLESPSGFERLAGMSLSLESTFQGNPLMEAAATQRVNVLPAQYSFVDLYGWSEAMKSSVLAIPGVVSTDIAEDRNRLRIGIEEPHIADRVRDHLTSLGVPPEAVLIEVTARIRRLSTLRDKFRPLMGGIQVNFSYYACTLGFIASRMGVTGMVTNSHCTNVQGGGSGTSFHQPVIWGSKNRIALETVDPKYFRSGACPSGMRCRYSDSAFARIAHPWGPAVTTSRGMIARPARLNSLTLSTGRFRITSETRVPMLNETVNKVGRTTGWSQGKVIGTCVDTGVTGTDIVQLCQDWVDANVDAGDSGSPVFRITNNPARHDVSLYGILWGGGTLKGYGTVFVFSSLSGKNLQRSDELGGLTTCASGFHC
jgi:hypothetical protein